ncbi:MAG: lipopolysaccharide biosynthesis protein [Flavobacteriales bacterium]|nr:lipopolysaccharide biosynthesis protein [Flavobacteriales bacterium]
MPLRRAVHQFRQDLRRSRTEGSFARHSFQVFSGNALAMASQLVLTPLLGRIYGPEAYGVYGIFMALMMNLSYVADMGLSTAYVLPRDEETFRDLFRINLTTALGICALTAVAALFAEHFYTLVPSWSALGGWVHFVGPAALLYALSVYFTQWLTRAKLFKVSAFTGATLDLSTRLFNLLYGVVSGTRALGLILGDAVVRTAIIPVYVRPLMRHGMREVFTNWSWHRMRSTLREYRRYPLMVFPERWVASLGLQLPVFALSSDLAAVGHFSLGASLLLIPLRLFGFSFSTVYMQKASELSDRTDELRRITLGLYKRLYGVGILPFLLLTFFADAAFDLLFGGPWRDAGVFTAYMGGFFFFRLLSDPMVSLFNVQRREHVNLVFQVVLTVARGAAMAVVGAMGLGSGAIMLSYALVSMAGYMVLSTQLLSSVGLAGLRITLKYAALLAVAAAAMAALRFAVLGSWFPLYGG